MQLVLRFVLSMSASRGSPWVANALVLGEQRKLVRWSLRRTLEENSSGASWGEAVTVGPRLHSPRRRLLKGCQTRNSKWSVTDADASVAKFTKIRQKEHL